MILASLKNFDNRLHNLKCFFLFSRDFVLVFSGLFFRFTYKAMGFFFRERAENIVVESERLIDRVKKGYCFFCDSLLWMWQVLGSYW